MIETVPLFALIAPLILWPIETLLPFPYVIEEITKALLVYPLASHTHKYKLTLLTGILFSFSETVLYFFNIFSTGSFALLIERLFLTTTLHTTTALIITFFASKHPKLIVLGVTIGIFIHYLYNHLISPF